MKIDPIQLERGGDEMEGVGFRLLSWLLLTGSAIFQQFPLIFGVIGVPLFNLGNIVFPGMVGAVRTYHDESSLV